MRRHSAWSILVLSSLSLVVGSCGATPPSGGTTAPVTLAATAVGPIPGPATDRVPGLRADELSADNPYVDDRTAAAEGRQLFVRFNCSGCHGGRAGGGMGPSLRDVDWIYGKRDAQVYSSIAEGRAHGMPSWQPRLTADQIWKLVAYIKALRTSHEPQPPPTE